jgi:ribosomal protein L14E/L6E/L27E
MIQPTSLNKKKSSIQQESIMIGQFVTSRAGHDKDTLYVIVAEDGDFAALCDGRLKPVERPKRKRWKHIQPISKCVEAELMKAIQGGKATNEQIKRAIKQQAGV